MKSRIITIVFLLCFLCACVGNNSTPVQIAATEIPLVSTATLVPISAATIAPTATTSPTSNFSGTLTPKQYLDLALDIMQNNSINRNQIDWVTLRAKAHERANGAKSYADTYEAIRFALRELGDNHSQFYEPNRVEQLFHATAKDFPSSEGKFLEEKLGYVLLPTFNSGDRDQQVLFATTVQKIIRDIDSQSPCGWMIDLQENRGGTTSAMLAGIGPVLGEGRVGSFLTVSRSADKELQPLNWFYENGVIRIEQEKARPTEVDGGGYKLKRPDPPVAILTSKLTASAAEAVVVAFAGRPNTRRFGIATAGVPTGNRIIPLSDGAAIVLTMLYDVDRTGKIYDGPIAPDEVITDKGETLKAATKWLLNQPACIGNK